MWKVLLAVMMVSVVGIGTALVQENKSFDIEGAPEAVFTWSGPTAGTPVHHYLAQVEVNDRDILVFDQVPSESISLPVVYGNKYRIRVAAVDASNIQGPMSPWSVPYSPELGPPGF